MLRPYKATTMDLDYLKTRASEEETVATLSEILGEAS